MQSKLLVSKKLLHLYLIATLYGSWFSMGIWAIYTLRFTSYKGLGLIELITSLTALVFKIPGGYLSDRLGREKTLRLAFAIGALGYLIKALANTLLDLSIASVFLAVADILYFSTMPAYLFETLREKSSTKLYSTVASVQDTFFLAANATAGLLGGWVYDKVSPRAPFFVTAFLYLLGCLMLQNTAPKSPTSNRKRTLNLAHELTQTLNTFTTNAKTLLKKVKPFSFLLTILTLGTSMVIMYELIDDLILIEYHLSGFELGLASTVILLLGALLTALLGRLTSNSRKNILTFGIIYSISLLLAPKIGVGLAIVFATLRTALSAQIQINTEYLLNKISTDSKRASLQATYSALTELPYVIAAVPLASLVESYSARNIAALLAVPVLILLLVSSIKIKVQSSRKRNTSHP